MTTDNKPRRIITRVSETEFQCFLTLVQSLTTTRCRMMRHLIRERLGMGPDLLGQDIKTIGEGVYQLGALGRTLNQQQRAVNSGQIIAGPLDAPLIGQVKDQIKHLESQWIAAVKRSRNEGTGRRGGNP